MIWRYYQDLGSFFHPHEVLVLYGPRRVGKTTLLEYFLKRSGLRYRLETGDNILAKDILSSQDLSRIQNYLQGFDLLAIDEAQSIPRIGENLKLIIDKIPGVEVIATGSSSFDLSFQTGEPLTGRKTTLTLYPLSQLELLHEYKNKYDLKQKLEEFLIFGTYPNVVTALSRDEKIRLIEEMVGSYILKDILASERIKGPKILIDLLKLLAYQIGYEVSLNELARSLSLDGKTVRRYLDLLEKTFIITRIGGFSRNLRSEVTNKSKYYFLDNGIRNGIISQFNAIDLRNDIGQLWENFVVIERLKKRTYQNIYGESYFWRTYEQQEIDLIEERDGQLFAFECKWSSKHTKILAPEIWKKTYPNASNYQLITPNNYLDFVA